MAKTNNTYPDDFQKIYNSIYAAMGDDATLRANIEGALKPLYQQNKEDLEAQRIARNAEIDVDAASRGMGNSTWVTDAKLRQMRASESALAALDANYNNQLYSNLADAMKDRDNLAFNQAQALWQAQTANDQWKQQFDTANNQWQQQFDWQKLQQNIANSQWQQQFDAANNQWQSQFDWKKLQQDIANSQWQQQFDAANDQWKEEFGFSKQQWQDKLDQWKAEFDKKYPAASGGGTPGQSNAPVITTLPGAPSNATNNKPPATINAPYIPSYVYRPQQPTNASNQGGKGKNNRVNSAQ